MVLLNVHVNFSLAGKHISTLITAVFVITSVSYSINSGRFNLAVMILMYELVALSFRRVSSFHMLAPFCRNLKLGALWVSRWSLKSLLLLYVFPHVGQTDKPVVGTILKPVIIYSNQCIKDCKSYLFRIKQCELRRWRLKMIIKKLFQSLTEITNQTNL